MPDQITITKSDKTWVIRAGGAVLGESKNAIELKEGQAPSVIYFPREHVAMAFLEPSDTSNSCARKGKATYYSIQTKSVLIKDAAWSYEDPNSEVQQIAGYLAFDTNKAAVEQI